MAKKDRIIDLILQARAEGCSDIHIGEGIEPVFRSNGRLKAAVSHMTAEESREAILELLHHSQRAELEQNHNDLDFAFQTPDGGRQRMNVFWQQGKLAASIRLLNAEIPSLESLGLPEKVLLELANLPQGLVLVTGPTGSGKSTTLAAILAYINRTRAEHIITVEDPIEYIYPKGLSLIHQREVGRDTPSFSAALRSALREDPDIILVGEMRDYETVAAALTAAETGHLVFSTLHTAGAAQTIERIIDASPAEKQNQVRTQLAIVLKGIVTQSLLSTLSGEGRIPATEILIITDAVANMIRENKSHQIGSSMQLGAAMGMHTLNADLMRLVRAGYISWESAWKRSNNRKELEQYCC